MSKKVILKVLNGARHAALAAAAVPAGAAVTEQLEAGRIDWLQWEHILIFAVGVAWKYVGKWIDSKADGSS